MKVILQDNRRFVLRFDKGEELFSGLTKWLKSQHIQATFFSAIGTCSKLELGYFNQENREYKKKPFDEDLEILSLSGNSAMVSGEPVLHVHGSFSRSDFSAIGGHVFSLVVLATCEVFLIRLEGHMARGLNNDFDLNLLQ